MKSFILASAVLCSAVFANAGTTMAEIRETYKALDQMNSVLTCSDDSQCGSLPVGSRACGGPSAMIVVSSQNPNFAKVQELAKATETLEAKYNMENQMMSICSIEQVPVVTCVQNTCTAQ